MVSTKISQCVPLNLSGHGLAQEKSSALYTFIALHGFDFSQTILFNFHMSFAGSTLPVYSLMAQAYW